MADEIVIVPADPGWPAQFAQERDALLSEFGPQFVAVEHIGSTAVPHLDAKPVIDILGGVRSLTDADALLAPLCAAGWDTSPEFNATLTDRRFLLRRAENVRTHHLHLVEWGGEEWHRHLLFRDILRARPALAAEYGALKISLSARYSADREAYTDAKAAFIARALGGHAPPRPAPGTARAAPSARPARSGAPSG